MLLQLFSDICVVARRVDYGREDRAGVASAYDFRDHNASDDCDVAAHALTLVAVRCDVSVLVLLPSGLASFCEELSATWLRMFVSGSNSPRHDGESGQEGKTGNEVENASSTIFSVNTLNDKSATITTNIHTSRIDKSKTGT